MSTKSSSSQCLIPTKEQRAIINFKGEVAEVLAAPGAGKTTTLCLRAQYLIQTCGVRPGDILAISFSKRTVSDLNRRLRPLGVTAKTFHAFALSLLKANLRCLSLNSIPSLLISRQQRDLVEAALKKGKP